MFRRSLQCLVVCGAIALAGSALADEPAAASTSSAQPGPVDQISTGAKTVGESVKEGAVKVGHGVKEGAVAVGHAASKGAHRVKNAAVDTGHAAARGAHQVKEDIVDGSGSQSAPPASTQPAPAMK